MKRGEAASRAARRTRSGKPGAIWANACSRRRSQAWFSVFIAVVVLSQSFAGAVEPRLHGRDARPEALGDLRVAAALLNKREERAVLGPELGERMPERVELLRVDGAVGASASRAWRRAGSGDAPACAARSPGPGRGALLRWGAEATPAIRCW